MGNARYLVAKAKESRNARRESPKLMDGTIARNIAHKAAEQVHKKTGNLSGFGLDVYVKNGKDVVARVTYGFTHFNGTVSIETCHWAPYTLQDGAGLPEGAATLSLPKK